MRVIAVANQKVYVYDGSNWSLNHTFPPSSIQDLTAYNGKLYAGIAGNSTSTGLYVYDGNCWCKVNGFPNDNVNSLGVYNNKLYVGVTGSTSYS